MALKLRKLNLVLSFSFLLFATNMVGQKRLTYGVKSNVGFYGVELNLFSRSEKSNDIQNNLFITIPKGRYSLNGFMRYTFFRKKRVSLSVQVEAGYTYSSFRKEWHFRTGYDDVFNVYTRDIRIIHELQSHQLVLPVMGQLQIRNWIGSLGFIRSRYLSATANRTKQRLTPRPIGGWTYELTERKATTTAKADELIDNAPYLNQLRSSHILLNLNYQLKENIIIGIELTTDIDPVIIQVYTNQTLVHGFYYDTQSLTFSVSMVY